MRLRIVMEIEIKPTTRIPRTIQKRALACRTFKIALAVCYLRPWSFICGLVAVLGSPMHGSFGFRFRFQDLKPGDVRKKAEDKIATSQVFARRGRDDERSGG